MVDTVYINIVAIGIYITKFMLVSYNFQKINFHLPKDDH